MAKYDEMVSIQQAILHQEVLLKNAQRNLQLWRDMNRRTFYLYKIKIYRLDIKILEQRLEALKNA